MAIDSLRLLRHCFGSLSPSSFVGNNNMGLSRRENKHTPTSWHTCMTFMCVTVSRKGHDELHTKI